MEKLVYQDLLTKNKQTFKNPYKLTEEVVQAFNLSSSEGNETTSNDDYIMDSGSAVSYTHLVVKTFL